jgi:hypothetical protein
MKYIISILLMFISLKASAPNEESIPIFESRIIVDPFLVLWDHVSWVETRHQDIISKYEPAYGRGQITKAKLNEFNKENKKHYTLKDCMKESIAREIFLWHCTNYSTFEWAAKRWNGSGKATITYWNKVQTLPLLEARLKLIELRLWKIKELKLSSPSFMYSYTSLPGLSQEFSL